MSLIGQGYGGRQLITSGLGDRLEEALRPPVYVAGVYCTSAIGSVTVNAQSAAQRIGGFVVSPLPISARIFVDGCEATTRTGQATVIHRAKVPAVGCQADALTGQVIVEAQVFMGASVSIS